MHGDVKKMHRTKIFVVFFLVRKWKKRYLRGHDLVRRVDRQEEVLIWCMKCSGYARQRMGPTLMKCCRSEQVSTKEHGKILKTNSDSRRRQGSCQRGKIEYQRLLNRFEMEGFMARNGLWNLAKNKALQDSGAMLGEEGDAIRDIRQCMKKKSWEVG